MSENNSAPKRPRLRLPLIVEGRYDKSAVLGMVDGTVITTDGFGIFNSEEKRALIKRLSGDGILLLTDSDGGGRQIRAFVSGLVPRDRLIHLYIPELSGKERRKRHAGAAGLLGVEGVGGEVLRRVLSPYLDTEGAALLLHFGNQLRLIDLQTEDEKAHEHNARNDGKEGGIGHQGIPCLTRSHHDAKSQNDDSADSTHQIDDGVCLRAQGLRRDVGHQRDGRTTEGTH